MLKIYGYSDDNLVCEGAQYPNDEISCFNQKVKIRFTDGTEISAGYPKKGMAIWWIKLDKLGKAPSMLRLCNNEEAEIYSDIFQIDAEIAEVKLEEKPPEPEESEEAQDG